MGGECICDIGLGDELSGQEDAFKKWSVDVFKRAVKFFCIDADLSFLQFISEDLTWSPETVRLAVSNSKQILDLNQNLSKLHNKNVISCTLVNKRNLQHEKSGFEIKSLNL